MKTPAAACAALGTLLAGLTLMAPPAQAAETCHGSVATVGLNQDGVYAGSEGPDVIVTHGEPVLASGGDDLVCAAGPSADIDAGPGDDTVDTSAATDGSFAVLGLGDDVFVGGAGGDAVLDGPTVTQSGPGQDQAEGIDVIITGDGADAVSANLFAVSSPDTIATGTGRDSVSLGQIDPHLDLDVGVEKNRLIGAFDHASSDDVWRVDAGAGAFTIGRHVVPWAGHFSRFDFGRVGNPVKKFVFLGTERSESLRLADFGFPASVDMGRGDDVARVSVGRKTAGSRLIGGPGQDQLLVYSRRALVNIDLARRRLDVGLEDPTRAGVVDGFEQLQVSGLGVRITGTRRAETFLISGCNVTVTAGGGADLVNVRNDPPVGCRTSQVNLRGGAGADRLIGSRGNDLIIGGPGRDSAYGLDGVDTCRAEVTRRCERA